MLCVAVTAVFPAVNAEVNVAPRSLPPGINSISATGFHNAYRVTRNVYSGSAPENEAAFAQLARFGVKTIISVDGSRPKVELARKHGMRYVHLPHGYDGINTNVQTQLIKASRLTNAPVFVHCHHGLHRGPTAVALICMANEGWTAEQGESWLKAAGTGSDYSGLYESVREFQKPSEQRLKAISEPLPETAQVPGLVESMVAIDECWEHLKAVRKAGYRKSEKHPDVEPAHEATILWEHLREAQRMDESKALGADFMARMKSSEEAVKSAERSLRQITPAPIVAPLREELDRHFDAIARSCVTCHRAYRDRK